MFGMEIGHVIILICFVVCFIIPIIANYYLAKSRGVNVIAIFLLTILFGFIITLILAFSPEVENKKQ